MFRRFLILAGIASLIASAVSFSTGAARAGEEIAAALEVDGAPHGTALLVKKDGALFVDCSLVRELGVTVPSDTEILTEEDAAFVPLAALGSRIRWIFDDQTVTLRVTLVALDTKHIDLAEPVPTPAPVQPNAYVNYDVAAGGPGGSSAVLSASASTGRYRVDANLTRGRYAGGGDAAIEREDLTRASTIRAGSIPARDRDGLVDSAPLLGVSARRDPTLHPGVASFPRPSIAGIAAVPGTADVYVDGALVRTVQVSAGAYELQGIPTAANGGRVDVVLHGIDGSTSQTHRQWIADPALLARGTTAYAYAAGVRTDSRAPVTDASYRIGATDRVTLGGHIVAQPARSIAEVSADLEVGRTLVRVAGAMTPSGRGAQASVRVPISWGSVGVDVVHRPAAKADPSTAPPAVDSLGIFTSSTLGRDASISASFQQVSRFGGSRSSITSIAMQRRLGDRGTFSASVERQRAQLSRTTTLLGMSLSMQIGRRGTGEPVRTIEATAATTGTSIATSIDRGAPYGSRVDTRIGAGLAASSYAVRTPAGTFGASIQRYGSGSTLSLEAHGAMAAIDHHIGTLAHVDDGFALVEAPELPDVAVSVDRRPGIRTNRHGYGFVAGLTAGLPAELALDYVNLPLDVQLDTTSRFVNVSRGAGAVVRFAAHAVRLVEGRIVRSDGFALWPYGSIDVGTKAPVHGRLDEDGRFVLDGVGPGIHPYVVTAGGYACHGTLTVPMPSALRFDLGILRCD